MECPADISLTFADGEAMHFPAMAGESILVSAEKAGNSLANNCREGTCRTCVARDQSGAEVLLCQQPARAGLSFILPYRRADLVAASLRRAKINSFQRLSRSVWEIRYRLQFPLPFLPGQYVEADFPGLDGPRRFSMANAPLANEHVLHVRDIEGGGMSSYLGQRAKPQDAFTVRGPFGVFYLRSTRKPKLFVAGGTGLAPILSMLSSIEPGSSPPLALVVGFAAAEDAYALDALRELAARLPLEIVLAADRPGASWSGIEANPVEAIGSITSIPFGQAIEAYLCGPPGMVTAARKVLESRGVTAGNVFNEEFRHTATE